MAMASAFRSGDGVGRCGRGRRREGARRPPPRGSAGVRGVGTVCAMPGRLLPRADGSGDVRRAERRPDRQRGWQRKTLLPPHLRDGGECRPEDRRRFRQAETFFHFAPLASLGRRSSQVNGWARGARRSRRHTANEAVAPAEQVRRPHWMCEGPSSVRLLAARHVVVRGDADRRRLGDERRLR